VSRYVLVPNFHFVGVFRSIRLELCDPGPGMSSSLISTNEAIIYKERLLLLDVPKHLGPFEEYPVWFIILCLYNSNNYNET
jgi:hypothetical protein